MKDFHKLVYTILAQKEESNVRKAALAPLELLSFFYGLALKIRIFLFDHRVFQVRTLPCKVVSVGNITLGGTGKTPFVCLLAEMFHKKGYATAVLSRGYRGTFRKPTGVVSDGQKILMSPQEAGDEPFLLAETLTGVPVLVGKERGRSGQYAVDRFHSQVLILDDGFQHLGVKRDLNLLLIDSISPFGNGYLFPRGSLREPVEEVSRADAIVLTKGGNFDNIKKLKRKFQAALSGLPVFRVEYRPGTIRVAGDNQNLSIESLHGRRILAFAGIAKPDSFRRTLLGLNARIACFEPFPDHHAYRSRDIERLWEKGKDLEVEAIVTTEKDAVRLRNVPRHSIPLWILTIRHEFLENDGERFEEFFWKYFISPP
jgi:tetraacyldisaccharide 4'-kinase